RARLRVDGGIKTGRDVVVAALLGADEVSFGTALLIAEGCLLVRSCHLDTCPVGIATQDPELRAKFAATPEAIETYLLFVAEEVRRLLARLGLRTFAEAVGRTDLLRPKAVADRRAAALEVASLLGPRSYGFQRHEQLTAPGGELGTRLLADAVAALDGRGDVELRYEISNRDRTVGARLGAEAARRFGPRSMPASIRARFDGAAGQSFGAFLSDGIELELTGEANDYVGKGMGGGVISVCPPPGDAGDPVLVGNTVLYGATGGELYCAGRAGERFAVRNSGATAVVEGTGDHTCEYMTGGTVVVLGDVGANVAAGMSGGELYVLDDHGVLPLRLNAELVVAEREAAPRELIAEHFRRTASARAADVLRRWNDAAARFWCIRPRPATQPDGPTADAVPAAAP
ncbi:MAG TPA: glutamate synthase-related protein, partial [Gaiellaceae bacterium]|nr:glutamate synthase-related protein [Gaiellaceae bacterium]